MSDMISAEGNGLMGLFHGNDRGLDFPKPFEREIFLFNTYIAGTTHIEGMDELKSHLNINEKLSFFREPDNQYDKDAIAIKTLNGVKSDMYLKTIMSFFHDLWTPANSFSEKSLTRKKKESGRKLK